MKTTHVLPITLAASLLLSLPAFGAQSISFPADKPLLALNLPGGWTSETEVEDGEETLMITSPDGEIEIELWAIDRDDVADDPKAAVMDAVEEVNEIIDDWVTDFEVSAREELVINGIYVAEVRGTGIYREDDTEVNVSVDILTPDDESVLIMMYWGEPGAEQVHMEDLRRIVESLRPASP